MTKNKFAQVYEFFDGDELRANVLIDKYLLKDREGVFVEYSVEELINRVCKTLAKTTDNPKHWQKEFYQAINGFKGVCPQGSILSAAGNKYFLQSLSNCFVTYCPDDSMASIFKAALQEATVMKHRGGDGMDLSKLRPCGSLVANAAGTSSGTTGFAEFFSNVCRTIAQSGRRGALMLTLDIKHPDALDWAKMKQDLKKTTKANISLKISDEFMRAVTNKEKFTQQWPVDAKNPKIKQEVDARKLWHEICNCAWASGEPGILMWDNITKMLPAHRYEKFHTICTNPCSEIPLSFGDSCRLVTICLINYVRNAFQHDVYFDFEAFEKDVRVAMRMLDAVIDVEVEHIDTILKKVKKERNSYPQDKHELDFEIELWQHVKETALAGRRTGLGTHGLADCLAQLGIKYDTDEALWMVDRIYGSLCHNAYDESVNMAIEKEPFPEWKWETEKDCPFFDHFPDWLLKKMKQHGRRNISILTNAPTGSIAMLSGCSSGIEPTFRLCYTRRRKINTNDINSKVDFVDHDGDKWHNYPVFEKNIKHYFDVTNQEPPNVCNDEELMTYLPSYFTTANRINWRKKIELVALAQKYIDHSISQTLNFTENTSVQTIKNAYMYAWEKGLKGITVYRDGCRTGVLVTNQGDRPNTIIRQEAPTRPEYLSCDIHPVTVQGEGYIVIVGLMGASVYEVFAGKHCNNIAHKKNIGQIRKVGRKKYILLLEQDNEELEIDINKYFENPQYSAITRLVSTSLRHGTPLEFIITQLQKSSEALMGFEKCLARVLKKYVSQEDLAKTIRYCEKCESMNIEVRFIEGCSSVMCHDCNVVDYKCS